MKRTIIICLALLSAGLRLWGGKAEIGLVPSKSLSLALESGGFSLDAAVFRDKPSSLAHLFQTSLPNGVRLAAGDYAPLGAARLLLGGRGGGASRPLSSGLIEKGGPLRGLVCSGGRFAAFFSSPVLRRGAPAVLGALARSGGLLAGLSVSEAAAGGKGLSTDWRTRFPPSPIFSLAASAAGVSDPPGLALDIAAVLSWNSRLGLRRGFCWTLAWEGEDLKALASRASVQAAPSALRPDRNPRPVEEASLQATASSGRAQARIKISMERGPSPPNPARGPRISFKLQRRIRLDLGGASLSIEGSSAFSAGGAGADGPSGGWPSRGAPGGKDGGWGHGWAGGAPGGASRGWADRWAGSAPIGNNGGWAVGWADGAPGGEDGSENGGWADGWADGAPGGEDGGWAKGAPGGAPGASAAGGGAGMKDEFGVVLRFDGGSLGVRIRNLSAVGLEIRLGEAAFSAGLGAARCSIAHTQKIGDGELRIELSENRRLEISYALGFPD